MKAFSILLAILLITSQTFGQKKSKQTAQADTLTIQIDSLSKVTESLTFKLDSVSGELVKYMSVYNTIKEKVLHYDFDPTRSSFLIDSMQAVRDSTALLSAFPKPNVSPDSITLLINQTIMLKAKADSIRTAWDNYRASMSTEEIEKAKTLNSLKQLKELYDNKIITEAEFITLKKKYLEKL